MGVPQLDLLELYEAHRGERSPSTAHDAHPNAYAHALARRAIGEFLDKNVGQRAPLAATISATPVPGGQPHSPDPFHNSRNQAQ